jgi:anti-anti-sigma factor
MVEFDASEKQGDRGYMRIRGDLAGETTVEEFKQALEDHYVNDGVRRIVVDLSGLTYISLEGVATLVSLLRESEQRGKRFEVVNAPDEVREKLEVTGVFDLLTRG